MSWLFVFLEEGLIFPHRSHRCTYGDRDKFRIIVSNISGHSNLAISHRAQIVFHIFIYTIYTICTLWGFFEIQVLIVVGLVCSVEQRFQTVVQAKVHG